MFYIEFISQFCDNDPFVLTTEYQKLWMTASLLPVSLPWVDSVEEMFVCGNRDVLKGITKNCMGGKAKRTTLE